MTEFVIHLKSRGNPVRVEGTTRRYVPSDEPVVDGADEAQMVLRVEDVKTKHDRELKFEAPLSNIEYITVNHE